MHKKTIFFIFLGFLLIPVAFVMAAQVDACTTIKAFQDLTTKIGAAVVVIGWIIAGVLYLTAGGAPEKVGTAKKALIACIIGTVIIIIAATAYDFINGALNLGGTGSVTC